MTGTFRSTPSECITLVSISIEWRCINLGLAGCDEPVAAWVSAALSLVGPNAATHQKRVVIDIDRFIGLAMGISRRV